MDTHIASFITIVGDYLTIPAFASDKLDAILNQLLESDTIDLTDKNTTLFSYYFHSLYWLLQSFTDYNDSVKKCVDILIKLCSKDSIRTRLMKNVFFIPLCNFLSDAISKDDKYKLLKLIDLLSNNIKLSFLPDNIYHTLDILSTWTVNQNELISAISLQILANICYKNNNIKFNLRNSIHFKPLFKFCLEAMDNSINANKLLMILKTNEHEFPLSILKLLTYEDIFECVQNGNVRALRDKVDFFFDIRSLAENGFNLLNSEEFDVENKFIKYLEDAPRDTVTGAQLAAETLRFLRLLISHNVIFFSTPAVINRLSKVGLIWCNINNAELIYNMDCAQIEASLLLLALVDHLNKICNKDKSVLNELTEKWHVLLDLVHFMLKSGANNDNTALHLALVRLMRACFSCNDLREHVVNIYQNCDMTYILNISASQQNSKLLINLNDVFFDNSDTCMTVDQRLLILYTVALLIDLYQCDNKCHMQILAHAHIQNVLSQILLSKNDEEGAEVKAIVLYILQSGYVPVKEFCQVLTDMPVVDRKIDPIKQLHFPEINIRLSNANVTPWSRLEADLKAMLHTGKIDEYTEEIIKMFSLRISEVETREKLTKENLSAQSKTLALVEQQIEHYNIEREKMIGLTIMRESAIKGFKKETIDLKDKLDKQDQKIQSTEAQCLIINAKFNDSLYQIEQLRKELKDGENDKENLKRQHEDEILKYQHKIKKQEKTIAKSAKELEIVNENSEKLKQSNTEVQNDLQLCQDELTKKNAVCAQRLKDLIEIRKENEELNAKIDAVKANFLSVQRMFN